jgi:hypothetical protein
MPAKASQQQAGWKRVGVGLVGVIVVIAHVSLLLRFSSMDVRHRDMVIGLLNKVAYGQMETKFTANELAACQMRPKPVGGTILPGSRNLVVVFIEPRPHARVREVFANLLAVASRHWGVATMRVSMFAGKGLKSWVRDMYELGMGDARRIVGSEGLRRMRVSLIIEELPSRNLTPEGYSDILIRPDLWHTIAAEGWCGNATHVLTVQTDAWLTLAASDAPSVWEFARRYDYVGGPGNISSWTGFLSGCPAVASDGVCSLDGGLSLRSIGASMRGINAFPFANQGYEDMYFMRAIAAAGGESPRDSFGRRFCTFQYRNPPTLPPLGYHKPEVYHGPHALASMVQLEPGLLSHLSKAVLLYPVLDMPNSGLLRRAVSAVAACILHPFTRTSPSEPGMPSLEAAPLCTRPSEGAGTALRCDLERKFRAVVVVGRGAGSSSSNSSVEVVTLHANAPSTGAILRLLAQEAPDEERLFDLLERNHLTRADVAMSASAHEDGAAVLPVCTALSLPLDRIVNLHS